MLIYHHPADTVYAKDWAIWKKFLAPPAIKTAFSHADRPFYITKNVGSGIVLVDEYATWSSAESRYIAICNHSDADDYLGAGRASVIAINLNTQTVRNGVITAL